MGGPTVRAWWLVSVALVALVLAALVLAALALDGPMPLALRAAWAALVLLWATALVYCVVRRW
jgi:hypothetical protein